MPCFDNFTAVILTGGTGSRMGGARKPLIEIDGEPIIAKMLRTLKPLFSKIIIAGEKIELSQAEGIVYVEDRFAGGGPLAGIEAALVASDSEYLFVFAGDMPSVSEEIITAQIHFMLANPCDIVIPRTEKGIEPLHAVINSRIASALTQHLTEKGTASVRSFYLKTDIRYFNISLSDRENNPFRNINTPEDLQL